MNPIREMIDMLFDSIEATERCLSTCTDPHMKKSFKKELKLLTKAQDALCEVQRMIEEEKW